MLVDIMYYMMTSVFLHICIYLLLTIITMLIQIEQAGGASTTGEERILEILPQDIHQRCPIFIGSKHDIDILMTLMSQPPPHSS